MIKSYILKDKENNYLTLTDDREFAFRFENYDIVQQLIKLLGVEAETIKESVEIRNTADIHNNW